MIFVKRLFDVLFSTLLIVLLAWMIFIAWIISTIDTGSNGIFSQARVGLNGKLFDIYKIRTMRVDSSINTTITQSTDPRITRIGAFFRRTKIDELPQLWNILIGDMSFVGPRPDVPGYADKLSPDIKNLLLSVRPGVTGPATLIYRNEEITLSKQSNPENYNNVVIYPNKVRINLEYIINWKLRDDIKIILLTIFNR